MVRERVLPSRQKNEGASRVSSTLERARQRLCPFRVLYVTLASLRGSGQQKKLLASAQRTGWSHSAELHHREVWKFYMTSPVEILSANYRTFYNRLFFLRKKCFFYQVGKDLTA